MHTAELGLSCMLVRTPIETDLAFQLKVMADSEQYRPGLCALVRKLLKLGEVNAVALCSDLMEPTPQVKYV